MSNFALNAISRNMKEASLKSRKLYRQAMRDTPKIIRMYGLEITEHDARLKIRKDFAKNKSITEPYLVDVLVHKGMSDLEEARQMFMTKSHVMGYFDPDPKMRFKDEGPRNDTELLNEFFSS